MVSRARTEAVVAAGIENTGIEVAVLDDAGVIESVNSAWLASASNRPTAVVSARSSPVGCFSKLQPAGSCRRAIGHRSLRNGDAGSSAALTRLTSGSFANA